MLEFHGSEPGPRRPPVPPASPSFAARLTAGPTFEDLVRMRDELDETILESRQVIAQADEILHRSRQRWFLSVVQRAREQWAARSSDPAFRTCASRAAGPSGPQPPR